ncbi:MAG: serine protease [Pseudomonadota bacterium]
MTRLITLIAMAAALASTAIGETGEAACANAFDPSKAQAWQTQTPCLEAKVRERVERPRSDGLFQNGQGFYVGDGSFILTAAHVVGGCQYFSVTDSGGAERNAGLVLWDARRDIAVLRPQHGGPLGQSGRGYGLELGFPPRSEVIGPVNIGLVDILDRTAKPPTLVTRNASPPVAAPLGPGKSIVLEGARLEAGASGAPVLNGAGEVVGMVTANIELNAGQDGPKLFTVATPSFELEKALIHAGGDNRVRPPHVNVSNPSTAPSVAENLVKIRCR